MAVIGNSFHNLIDHYKAVDPKGNYIPVIEAQTALNPIARDAYVFEANNGATNISSIRTGLPTPTWGKLYQGINQSKSTTAQVTDATGMCEGLSTIDTRLLQYKKNPARARADEAAAYMEAISQEMQTNCFYSDTASTPERFKGFAARYNSTLNSNVIDAGGTGSDNTSIWMISWGRGKSGLFYPEGMKAGIVREDKGEQRTLDADGKPYFVKEEYFAQHVGVHVGDWRYNVRIANIDVSELLAGNVDLYALLRKAFYRHQGRNDARMRDNPLNPLMSATKTVLYVNGTVLEQLDAQQTTANKVQLRMDEVEGREVEHYRGIKIAQTDAIINAEARVVA